VLKNSCVIWLRRASASAISRCLTRLLGVVSLRARHLFAFSEYSSFRSRLRRFSRFRGRFRRVLMRRFHFKFEIHRHVVMEFDRYLVLARGLDRMLEMNLMPIDLLADLVLQSRHDVLCGDRAKRFAG